MDVVVGLGANLGAREATLAAAVAEVGRMGRILGVSGLYETEPVGPPQPAYLNAALRLLTPIAPGALLALLLDVERRFGRVRREKWGARTLDLDILWIAGVAVSELGLVVPHASLHERRFALVPLVDVAPDALDPRSGEPLAAWLGSLPDVGISRVAGPGWVTSLR